MNQRHSSEPGASSRHSAVLEPVDVALPTLLSEAKRELGQLLRDMRAGADAGVSPEVRALLKRAIHCAVNQSRLQAELGNLALTDELTGLYNRRGFLAMGDRQLKLARRSGLGLWLFLLDVDGLKRINDSWGHFEGDRALVRTAEVLTTTFRASDVVARLGGDEFAVLAIEASTRSEATITARLREQLRRLNAKETRYAVSLSFGVARFSDVSCDSVGQLIVQADEMMYAAKRRRSKRAARAPATEPQRADERELQSPSQRAF